MSKYKILVLDLDGTLTNKKKEITPRTLSVLEKAQQKGLKIVLASGRPTFGIMPLAEQLNLKQYGGYILSYNGGKIINLANLSGRRIWLWVINLVYLAHRLDIPAHSVFSDIVKHKSVSVFRKITELAVKI